MTRQGEPAPRVACWNTRTTDNLMAKDASEPQQESELQVGEDGVILQAEQIAEGIL